MKADDAEKVTLGRHRRSYIQAMEDGWICNMQCMQLDTRSSKREQANYRTRRGGRPRAFLDSQAHASTMRVSTAT